MEKIEKLKKKNMNLEIENFNLVNKFKKNNSEITELKQKYGNQKKVTVRLIEENDILREEIDKWKERYKSLKK